MESKEFFEKHPEVVDSAKYYAEAMLQAGASEQEILSSVLPIIKLKSARSIDMTCPNCNGVMQQVLLKNNRKALYCKNDRVTIPMPV